MLVSGPGPPQCTNNSIPGIKKARARIAMGTLEAGQGSRKPSATPEACTNVAEIGRTQKWAG